MKLAGSWRRLLHVPLPNAVCSSLVLPTETRWKTCCSTLPCQTWLEGLNQLPSPMKKHAVVAPKKQCSSDVPHPHSTCSLRSKPVTAWQYTWTLAPLWIHCYADTRPHLSCVFVTNKVKF